MLFLQEVRIEELEGGYLMKISDLVKELDGLRRDYKRGCDDLPKNYVRGSEAMLKASEQLRNDYDASKAKVKDQIRLQLDIIKSKAALEQEVNATLSAPTSEQIDEGYKIIDVISKTRDSLTEDTLERLTSKIHDLDQLAVVNDLVQKAGTPEMKRVIKNRAKTLDSHNEKHMSTIDLVNQFEYALSQSGDSMNFTMFSLASQLSEVAEANQANKGEFDGLVRQAERKMEQRQAETQAQQEKFQSEGIRIGE